MQCWLNWGSDVLAALPQSINSLPLVERSHLEYLLYCNPRKWWESLHTLINHYSFNAH